MGWDATIFGTLSMSPAQYEIWLAREVDSSSVPDARKYLSTFEFKGETVQAALAPIAEFEDPEGLAFVELTQNPGAGTVELRSFMSEDEYVDNGLTLAAIWAAAAPEGTGELYFAGMLTAGFCYHLKVGPAGVTLRKLDANACHKLPVYEEIAAKVDALVAALDE